MNKLVKGAVATAAAAMLLMGGAGSLALWNDSATVASQGITAGTLTIAAPATAPTTDGWKSGSTVITDISAYRIVPGETLTYTKTFTVTAIGDKLTANIGVGAGSIVASTTGNTVANDALKSFLSAATSFKVDGATATTITATPNTKTVVVTASIPFTSGAAGTENAAKGGVVSLSAFNITLTQTPVV